MTVNNVVKTLLAHKGWKLKLIFSAWSWSFGICYLSICLSLLLTFATSFLQPLGMAWFLTIESCSVLRGKECIVGSFINLGFSQILNFWESTLYTVYYTKFMDFIVNRGVWVLQNFISLEAQGHFTYLRNTS